MTKQKKGYCIAKQCYNNEPVSLDLVKRRYRNRHGFGIRFIDDSLLWYGFDKTNLSWRPYKNGPGAIAHRSLTTAQMVLFKGISK